MPLSMDDYNRLSKAGFTYHEINMLSEAKDPSGRDQPAIDLTSPVWRETLNTRALWVNGMIARGWDKARIKEEIENYYARDEKRSPWDFLKAEYKPPRKLDYVTAIRNRARRSTGRLYKNA